MLYENINHNYGFYTGMNINFDIFDGFETRSNIQRSRNQLQINQESFQNTKRIVQSNIRNYCLQLQQFMEKMEISRESVESAGENLRLANERYRIGSGTLIETIDAQAQLTNARYSLVEMQYNAKSLKPGFMLQQEIYMINTARLYQKNSITEFFVVPDCITVKQKCTLCEKHIN